MDQIMVAQTEIPIQSSRAGASNFLQRKCKKCRRKEKLSLRRAAVRDISGTAPSVVYEVIQSPGLPLIPKTREFFEQRFGFDFSRVRVHKDSKAAESASLVNALAYTVGRDIVFGKNRYAPETVEGKRLLAHELTHVVQQSGKDNAEPMHSSSLSITSSGDRFEAEADQASLAIMQGERPGIFNYLGSSTAMIARKNCPPDWMLYFNCGITCATKIISAMATGSVAAAMIALGDCALAASQKNRCINTYNEIKACHMVNEQPQRGESSPDKDAPYTTVPQVPESPTIPDEDIPASFPSESTEDIPVVSDEDLAGY